MKSHITRFLSLALVLVLGVLSCTPALAADKTEFSDVPATHWAYDAVQECAADGIVTGFADGTFRPDENVTGVQFIAMLTRTFYGDEVAAVTTPAGQPWYYPNMEVATDVGMLKYGSYLTLTVKDEAMNRYDMAFVLASTLSANGKTAGRDERNNAMNSIKDAKSIPENRAVQVYTAYHYGIITGMTDGTFSGTQSMTRAQACSVIMRMMTLLNTYNPGDKDNDQHDDGESQNQGETASAGKLTNGKDATVANVVDMLKEIEKEYPTGTPWGDPADNPNTGWYSPTTTLNRDVAAIARKAGTSVGPYMCAGWAAMVSETIFGINGAPGREVYSFKDARPGDIVYQINNSTGKAKHVSIITNVQYVNGKWMAATCDGNISGAGTDGNGGVTWEWDAETGLGAYGMTNKPGTATFRIFTRYPEGLEELSE